MKIDDALEHVSDGLVGLDTEFHVAYANGRAELLLGKRSSELVGQGWWDIFPYLVDSPAEKELRAVAAGRLARHFKVFHPPRYAWHEVIDLAPVAISVLRGPDHRFEIVNQFARQLLGGRELEGRTVRSVLPELEGQGLFEMLDGVYSSAEPFHGSEVPITYDRYGDGGSYHGFFNLTYQPLFDVGGQVNGVLSVSVEVSDLVLERTRLEQRAAEQEAVLSQLAEGVIVTDREGRITFVNDMAEELHGVGLLGVAPEEYTEAYHLFTDEGEPYPHEELPLARAVLRDEVVTGARWRIRRPDGTELRVMGSARPVLDLGGQRLAAILTLRQIGDVPA